MFAHALLACTLLCLSHATARADEHKWPHSILSYNGFGDGKPTERHCATSYGPPCGAPASSTVSTLATSTKSSTTGTSSSVSASGSPTPNANSSCSSPYWLENIKHQGIAAFNSDPSTYQVFRNVKDFGAKGNGVADDTVAINLAISSGDRCAPGSCNSSTTTPAVVYFPAGTYIVSGPIIDYYYTQLVGNPNCLPVLKASSNFTGGWIIDGDEYLSTGALAYGATNVFWRQVRNFVLDLTSGPASLTGVHWPTGQATSLQNIEFLMSSKNGTQQQGVFIEGGSGGFMNDLVFKNGYLGLNIGNQQFTMRNLSFDGQHNAISMSYDWGWTFKSISISNCDVGLNMTGAGSAAQSVGSVVLLDSEISNTPIGVLTADSKTSTPAAAGQLVLENVSVPRCLWMISSLTLCAGAIQQRSDSSREQWYSKPGNRLGQSCSSWIRPGAHLYTKWASKHFCKL